MREECRYIFQTLKGLNKRMKISIRSPIQIKDLGLVAPLDSIINRWRLKRIQLVGVYKGQIVITATCWCKVRTSTFCLRLKRQMKVMTLSTKQPAEDLFRRWITILTHKKYSTAVSLICRTASRTRRTRRLKKSTLTALRYVKVSYPLITLPLTVLMLKRSANWRIRASGD